MLSRIALLRAVAVIAVLTVGGVAAAKMGRHNSAVTGDAQLAGVTAQADAAGESGDVAIRGHAMFPLGVPKGLASRSEERSESHPSAVGHLADLDQLRTAAGSGAAFWGSSGQSHNNGSSSAFGAHGFAGSASAFGGVGFGGGKSQSSDKKNAVAPASTAAVKTPTAPKSPAAPPAPPRTPASAAPVVSPAPTVAVPPAVPAPVAAVPTLAPPVTAVTVAPPIFSNQTTPIPAIAGGSPKTDPAPPAGVVGGGRVSSKVASLSPTPEPTSLLLIVTGLVAVIGASRRRQLLRP